MSWAFAIFGPLAVGYGVHVARTGWLPRWLAGRYEARLSGTSTVLQGIALTWLWVVAFRLHEYGQTQLPPVVLFAIGLVLANVAGMKVWRRRFDRTASSAKANRVR